MCLFAGAHYHGLMPRKRPPLCPYCRYDLTGTYHHGHRRYEITCSECGETFMSNEVGERRAHGEWTPIVGLRNLVVAAMWRVPIVAAVALVEFWLLDSWYGASSASPVGDRGFVVATVLAGCALGAVMNYRLNEFAGFEGGIVVTVSVLGLLSASALSYVVVHNVFAPTAVAPLEVIGVMTCGGAGIIFVLHAYHA